MSQQFKAIALQLAAQASDNMWPLCLVYWNKQAGGFQVAYHQLSVAILRNQGDAIKDSINKTLEDVRIGTEPDILTQKRPRFLTRKERRARASKQARKR